MSVPDSDRGAEILIVEDDPAAIRLVEEAFDEIDRSVSPVVLTDGGDAVDYLRGQGEHDGGLADLVLLDLDLPGRTGQQVLAEMEEDDELSKIPVIVFSGTDTPETVAECYRLGANAYVVKPMEYDEMLTVITRITDFWLGTAERPPS